MAFKGQKPSSQPRSLRSEIERKGTTPAGFSGGVQEGATPLGGEYKDEQVTGTGTASPTRSPGPADPSPFANLKGGH